MPPKRAERRNPIYPDPNIGNDGSGSQEDETRDIASQLNDQIEGLSEKRTDVREEALTKIVDGLKKQFMRDFVLANREHLFRAFKSGAGSPKSVLESHLSCQLLNLMALTVGYEWQDEYKGLAAYLKSLFDKLVEYEHKKEVTFSLGLIAFLWCEDDLEIQNLITFLNQQLTDALNKDFEEFTAPEFEYLASVMRILGLLLTIADGPFVLEVFLSEFIDNIETYLACVNSDIRCATGETFAYICSLIRRVEEEKGENYSCFYFNGYLSNVQETLDQITSYANGDQRSINKKDRERQSVIFGPVLQTFLNGVDPSEELTINNQTFHFSGWEDHKRLNFFREILGTGFQHHFANNQILGDIFDVYVESELQRLTSAQKKAFLQRSARQAKLRKQSIDKNRSQKMFTYD